MKKKWKWFWQFSTKQVKQHIQCWPLIRQAVGNEGATDVVDAKKDVCCASFA